MINQSVVDYVVIGEGEYTMLEICEDLRKNRHGLEEIKGLVFKQDEKYMKTNSPRPLESNLDNFPFPARHLILGNAKDRYFSAAAIQSPISAMITMRGCPYHCLFCSKMFETSRYRSPSNILDELKYLVEEKNIHNIQFRDETFNLNSKLNLAMCDGIIKNQWDVHWRALFRPDFIRESLVQNYKKAGCYLISMGAESGSERILKFLKKQYTVPQIRTAFRLVNQYALESHAYFIMGVPGETSDDILKTMAFIRELSPHILTSVFIHLCRGLNCIAFWKSINCLIKKFHFRPYEAYIGPI